MIYAKTVKELCIRRLGQKPMDPPRIHVVGKLVDLMLGRTMDPKYNDPNNLVVVVHINKINIANTLVDLGAIINIMAKKTLEYLGLYPRINPIVLNPTDRSTIKLEGILEDIIFSLDSCQYPTDFIVLQPKS